MRTISASRLLLPALMGGVALASCSAPSVIDSRATDHVGTSQSAIISGENSDASQDEVVLIVGIVGREIFTCTGTLLAPNLVITARHCVSRVNDGAFQCDEAGQLVRGSTGGTLGNDYPIAAFFIFKGSNQPEFGNGPVTADAKVGRIVHDDAKVVCGHDLALLLLDRSIPDAKIAPIRLDATTKVGEKFTAVGWGVTHSTSSPKVRQQRPNLSVNRVGPIAASADQTVPPLPPNDFETGESICQGDSGGPGLSATTGAVIGIVSAGGNGRSSDTDPAFGCTGTDTINQFTQIPPFKDLILGAFALAGHEPWAEDGPNPLLSKPGEACSDSAECQSGSCSSATCADFPAKPGATPEDEGCAAASRTPRSHDALGACAIFAGLLLLRRRSCRSR